MNHSKGRRSNAATEDRLENLELCKLDSGKLDSFKAWWHIAKQHNLKYLKTAIVNDIHQRSVKGLASGLLFANYDNCAIFPENIPKTQHTIPERLNRLSVDILETSD